MTTARSTNATLAWRLALVGVLIVGAGFVAVLVASIQGMQLEEGLSLVDGYWVGLLPWIEVGTWLIPIGGVVAFAGGFATVWLEPSGRLQRAATLPAIAVALFWVLLIVIETARQSGPDGTSSQTSIATAVYSSPQNAIVFLLLPTAFVAALAWASRRQRLEPAPTAAGTA